MTLIDADHLEVTYKDGTVDSYPLGLVIGEAAGEHHRHERITDLKVGDKFSKGEVLGWDNQWFQRDLFCPGQVVWKSGSRARIALVEDQDVFEDSIAISREFSLQCTTPYIKTKKFSIDVDQSVNMRVKVGDEVDYESILCEVEDSHLGFVGGETNTLIEEVNRLGIKQVRSNHHGKVIRIETTYNSGQVEMSESVSKLISSLDKDRKKRSKGEKTPVVSGAVSTSMNVKRPMIGPGRALFTIYIESADPSTVADKYVVGNQMKATVGAVMKDPLMTKDGRVIDVKNSFKGLFNRMVLSLRDKLVTNELAIEFTKLAIKKYRGE